MVGGTKELYMNSTTTALLLIEFQNDFTTHGGAQHEAVRAVMEQTGMMAHARATTDATREHGVAVLHAPIMFADGYPEMRPDPYGILAGIVEAQAFRKGTW